MGTRSWPLVWASLVTGGCTDDVAPRAQWLVTVQTNLPTASQTLSDDRFSRDASVDMLRVDVVRDDGAVAELREVIAADERDWPISFGVVSASGKSTLLRIRAFVSSHATVGTALGQSVLEPWPTTAIDRLMLLDPPGDGVRRAHIVLDGDCIGVPARFSPRATCIDASRVAAAPDAGSEESSNVAPGSWQPALEQPCAGTPAPGTVCIPGGFSVIGSQYDVGLADGTVVLDDPVPPRPVVVSPFFLDTTEVTVGRVRALLKDDPSALPTLPAPKASSGNHSECTWLGKDDATDDTLPVNCVDFELARAFCAANGGRLPTEAEWEHAARGRGQGRRFPWGDASPSCCTLAAGGQLCDRLGPVPVGETSTLECTETDRSRDGVLDLAGNVAELTDDDYVTYADERCWASPGVHYDPACVAGEKLPAVLRGSAYSREPGLATGTTRRPSSKETGIASVGFRCAVPGSSGP